MKHGRSDPGDNAKSSFTRIANIILLVPATVLLVGVAWWKASHFDPYTMSFFTKTLITPSPEMPGAIRTFGWVVIAIGGVLLYAAVRAHLKKLVIWRDAWPAMWYACVLLAFGGSFFVAAQSAQFHIDQRMGKS